MIIFKRAFEERISILLGHRKDFCIIAFINFIGLISIFRADYGYVDDIGRVVTGNRGWEDFSRYINQVLSVIIHGDILLNDISPIPQLLAIILMTVASLIVLIAFNKNDKIGFWSVVAVIPMTISPYFLECLSFKFDAPYMALSVLASVFPLLFLDTDTRIYSTIVFLSMLGMCMTYQASSGLFIVGVLLLLALKWNRGVNTQTIVKIFFVSAFSYFLALLVFKFVIMGPVDCYEYVAVSVGKRNSIFENILVNFKKYLDLIYNDCTHAWRIMLVGVCFSYLRSFIAVSVRSKIKAAMTAILLIPCCVMLSYGAYLVLDKPSFFPRAMYGFYFFVAILGLISVNESSNNLIGKVACVLLCWSFLTFSLAYGNALAEQKRYDEFRVRLVLQDLQTLPNLDNGHMRNMQIKGSIGFSPVVERMAERYKILSRLVPIRLHSGMPFGEYYIFLYFNLPGVKHQPNWSSERIVMDDTGMLTHVDTAYHKIMYDKSNILVLVK